MTTTPQEPDPDVVPSGDPVPTEPQPGIDPHEDPQTQPAPDLPTGQAGHSAG